MIPLRIQVYERGVAGVPTTSWLTDLRGRAKSYEHTISDRFGFESMSVSMRAAEDEINDWLQNGLMRSVKVYGPDGSTVWEGFLETISATLGQKRATLSIKNMANRVRTKYTLEVKGTPKTTATVQSATSQSLYGIKDRVASMSSVLDLAAATANQRMLNSLALPRSSEPTAAKTGSAGDLNLQLTFAGWYTTLDWVFVPSTFDGSIVNTVQALIADLLTSAAGINAFVSTDASNIPAFGYSLSNNVVSETTFRQQIDKYFGLGDNNSTQMAWGVYENRVLKGALWAGTTPSTITYREDARAGEVFDAYGNVVAPWDVRPNAMSEVSQLLNVGPTSGAVDAAARKYVARVVCSINGDSVGCTLEPTGGGDLERTMAVFGGRSSVIWG